MSSSTELEVDVAPFDLPGRGEAAALCIHGLTGTPYEVRPLGEAIAGAGIRARGLALPGHNATPEELAPLSYRAWLEAARQELEMLCSQHRPVFTVGLSLGGLLALALASEGRVDAVAAVGTPLALKGPVAALVPIAKWIVPFVRKSVGSDIRDPAARERHPSYPVMPLRSVHELIRLQRIVRAGLRKISVPLFVAHGRHDRTADPADAQRILRSVGDAPTELLMLENSGHVVPVDYDGAELSETLARFLVRHTPA